MTSAFFVGLPNSRLCHFPQWRDDPERARQPAFDGGGQSLFGVEGEDVVLNRYSMPHL